MLSNDTSSLTQMYMRTFLCKRLISLGSEAVASFLKRGAENLIMRDLGNKDGGERPKEERTFFPQPHSPQSFFPASCPYAERPLMSPL